MNLSPEEIIERLDFLRNADRENIVFGSESHRYQLRPVVDEATVSSIEEQFSVSIPNDYRQFVTQVGSGGAGPFYGLDRFEKLPEFDKNHFVKLNLPFTHRRSYAGNPELLEKIGQRQDVDAEYDRLQIEYCEDAAAHGSLTICQYGCCLRFFLVVNGPESGNMWFDKTADFDGVSPVAINQNSTGSDKPWCNIKPAPDQPRATFLQWYSRWLDHATELVDAHYR